MKRQSMGVLVLLSVAVLVPQQGRADQVSQTQATKMREPGSPLIVGFDIGKADIKSSRPVEAKFKEIAQELQNHPYARVEIDGFADAVGTADFNQQLSEQRAAAVRQHLIDKYGLKPNRIILRAFGETRPETDNATLLGRKENRRVVARVYRLDPVETGTDKPAL